MEHRMICLDNSEWMRNGDYTPTRIKAQREAANIVCTRHLNANPENTTGIMTLAGPRCTIHCTQSRDNPKLYRAISLDNTPLGGKSRFINGIKIARLALKNRPNKKGEARIVLFVGSPVEEDINIFKRVGRDLKKNSCGITVVLLGEFGDNKAKMEALVDAARKEEGQTCDLIIVPPGVRPLNMIRNSSLCRSSYQPSSGTTGGGSTGAGAGTAAESDYDRAIRQSLLEQGGAAGVGGEGPVVPAAMTEEEQVRLAIARSMETAQANNDSGAEPTTNSDQAAADNDGDESSDEDEVDSQEAALNEALKMSTEEMNEDADDEEAALIASAMAMSQAESDVPDLPEPDSGANFSNPDYVQELVSSMGTTIDDPIIRDAIEQARRIEQEKQNKNKSSADGGGDDGGNSGNDGSSGAP